MTYGVPYVIMCTCSRETEIKEGTPTGRKKIEDGFKTPQARYEAQHVTRFVVKVVHNTEPDILQRLEEEPNKSGYIKELIRKDIAQRATDTGQ